jgi:hypothetical protein
MSDRRRRLAERAAPLLLLAVLAVAVVMPTPTGLRLDSADTEATDRWTAALDGLPEAPTILVAFDADLGTYPEIRPTVRVALADLLAREARLAVISLTPEGRAVLLAELARLERLDVNASRLLDLGFVPGAEAALVSLAKGATVPASADGSIARDVTAEGSAAFDALLAVGGNDLGPRSWIEQYVPRVDPLPVLAITPTVLLPEVQPYLASGQLDALLGIPRDGATYRVTTDLGSLDRLRDPQDPPTAGVLLGLIAAIVALGHGGIARIARSTGAAGREQDRS